MITPRLNPESVLLKLGLLLILCLCIKLASAATITSGASGNWNSTTTWVGGVVPGSTDDVVINGNFTITVPAGIFNCGGITINAAATNGTSALIIGAGATLNSGSITATGGGAAARIANVTVSANGTLMISGNLTLIPGTGGAANSNATCNTSGSLNVTGSVDMNGTTGTSTATLYAQGGTVNIGGDLLVRAPGSGYAALMFTGSTTINLTGAASIFSVQNYSTVDMGTMTSTVNLTTGGSSLNISGTASCIFNMGTGGSTVNLAGSILNTGTFAAGNGTVNYMSSSSQNVIALNYYNLTFSNSGSRVLAGTGTIGIAGAFSPGNSFCTNTGSTINFNGTGAQTIPEFTYNNLTISGAHTTNSVTLANTGNIWIAGALANTSTYTTGSLVTTGSTIHYNGSAAQTIIAFPYYHLAVTKPTGVAASTVNNANITVAGNCTVYTGTLTVGAGTPVVGQLAEYVLAGNPSSSILDIRNGAKLNLLGTTAFPSSFPTSWQSVLLPENSNLEYSSNGSQTVVARQYGNLICSGAGSRTLASSGIIKIAGGFTPNTGTITYTITGSTVEYNGTAAQTIAVFNYNNLNISNAGANITLAGSAGVAGTFASTDLSFANNTGTINYNGTTAQTVIAFDYFNLTVSGNRAANSITLASSGLIQVAGALANSAVFTSGAIINTGSTVVYNGIGAQSVVDFPYNNLTINKPAGIASLAANLTTTNLKGNLLVQSRTLATNSFTITGTATKSLTVNNVATLDISGTTATFPTGFTTVSLAPQSFVIYSGTAAQTVAAQNYGNLTCSGTTARTLASAGTIRVATNFTSGTNTYTTTGSTVEFNGTGTQSLIGVLGNSANAFNNLSINNTGTAANDGLTLAQATTVAGVLNMMNGYLILNGNTLILTNSAVAAITRTNGVIISENTANSSKVQWNIGTATGAHVFPFGKSLSEYIPFTFNLTSGNASNITVSTYPTISDNTPLPVTPVAVTGISQQGTTDAADKVVDRFWQIDPSTAVARTATLTFTYAPGERVSQIITPKAQRWNGTSWDAAITGQTSTSNSITVPGVSTFSTWAIYDNTPPLAGFTSDLSSGCIGTNVQFTDTSLYNPTSWSWTFAGGTPGSSPLQNPLVTYNTAGTYQVILRATNAYGTDSVTKTGYITIYPTPATPAPTNDGPHCEGTTLNLTANVSGAANYAWTGPNSYTSNVQNPLITNTTVSEAGTYSLVVTQNGCSSAAGTTTVVINSTPSAPVASSNSPVCSGDTIYLTANTSGNVTYTWTGPSFTSSLQNPAIPNATTAANGTYSVTATENGCTSTAGTTTVVVNITPSAPTVSSNSPVCSGDSIGLTASAAGNVTYNWTGPDNFMSSLQHPSILNATTAADGTYHVTATENGCTSDTGTTVVIVNATPSIPTVSSNSPVCSGNSVDLTASAPGTVTYTWTGPDSFSSSIQNPSVANATTAASGTYSVTASENGCTSAAATTDVIVNQTPATPVVSNNSPVCSGGTINLTANTGGSPSYSWTGPNAYVSSMQNPNITNATTAESGTYSVTATENNCTSAAASTVVTVNSTPAIPAAAANDGPVCSGSTINLSVDTVSGATYSWTGPNGYTSNLQNPSLPNIAVSDTGTYNVSVSTNGCNSSASTVVMVNSLPVVTANASPSTTVCDGTPLTLTGSGADNYTWNNGVSDGVAFTPAGSDTYIVTGTDLNGCSNTDTISITVDICTGLKETAVNSFSVSPNPGNGIYMIDATINAELFIYNNLGQLMSKQKINAGRNVLNMENYLNGIYLLQIKNADSNKTIRLVKE